MKQSLGFAWSNAQKRINPKQTHAHAHTQKNPLLIEQSYTRDKEKKEKKEREKMSISQK